MCVCVSTYVPPLFYSSPPLFYSSQPHLDVHFLFRNSPPLCRWFIPRGLRWFCASQATAVTRTAIGLSSSQHAPTDTLPHALAKFSFHSLLAHTSSESRSPSLPPPSLPLSLSSSLSSVCLGCTLLLEALAFSVSVKWDVQEYQECRRL